MTGESRLLRTLVDLLLAVGAIVALFVMLGPGGSARERWQRWRSERAASEAIAAVWETAVSSEGTRLGAPDGEVVLVEFSDYQCPYCRESHAAVQDLLTSRPDVAIIVRHVPLTQIHPLARQAALVALCAEDQGAFQAMHGLLMESTAWQESRDWGRLARAAGVRDTVALRACLDAPETRTRLDADVALAALMRIDGTPTFVSRRGSHSGAASFNELESLVGSVVRGR